jgi:hypothetical protein
MVISNGLKKVIFKKLYEDLAHVEIISYNNSIWFIDRENKYWYLEYDKDGTLFWRYPFFNNFFLIFLLECDEYKPVISEWVEEVLKYKVVTTDTQIEPFNKMVEEVLNYKVKKTESTHFICQENIDNALEYKITEIRLPQRRRKLPLEEVLNSNGKN